MKDKPILCGISRSFNHILHGQWFVAGVRMILLGLECKPFLMKPTLIRSGTISEGRSMRHIPRTAMLLDTTISVVLSGIGIYHLTQPSQAWRSGTVEIICSILLLMAAYWLSHTKAMITNLAIAVLLFSLGIRHIIHGGGWKTGVIELVFAILLITAAVSIHKWKERTH